MEVIKVPENKLFMQVHLGKAGDEKIKVDIGLAGGSLIFRVDGEKGKGR